MQFRILIKGTPLFVYLKGLPAFLKGYREIKNQLRQGRADFPLGQMYPCLQDAKAESGVASGHYFHQDLLVAGLIFKNNPAKHVDIGSRIDGFVAHVASFREIEVLDIRQLSNSIDNISFRRFNLVDENFNLTDYCDSVSCLHALEHFGLGRYGDEINYAGHLIGWENIHKMLKKGGKFYFSVPIGPQRIEFNAHRVFSVGYLLDLIGSRYKIDSFSYVDDQGDLYRNAALEKKNIDNNYSCRYGCGIFELSKN
jgi:SAM-dependent methyltransferase